MPALGDRLAVARDDKRFAGNHGFDHFRVVVSQLALGNSPRHRAAVAP
jgi:hypothetical protein